MVLMKKEISKMAVKVILPDWKKRNNDLLVHRECKDLLMTGRGSP
jgi:hypothetical protein